MPRIIKKAGRYLRMEQKVSDEMAGGVLMIDGAISRVIEPYMLPAARKFGYVLDALDEDQARRQDILAALDLVFELCINELAEAERLRAAADRRNDVDST